MYVIYFYILYIMLYIYKKKKWVQRSCFAVEADSQESLIFIYFLLDTEKPLKDELGDTV